MKRGYQEWLWSLAIVVAACTREPQSEAPPVVSESTTPSVTTSAPETAPMTIVDVANITITKIEVANPLVISGEARTFENNVLLRARDARQRVISESFTTATGEMGKHSPYRGTVWLTRDPGERVIVEAFEHSAKDGTEINVAREERRFAVDSVQATLFFPDEGCTGVKPYTRSMPKSISMARLLIEALLAGPLPEERGAVTPFPRGSAVRSVNLREGVVTVDFAEPLQNVGGSCRAQMIRDSVTQTLLRLPTVKQVVITAGRSEGLALQP